jgi:hypothetical protein
MRTCGSGRGNNKIQSSSVFQQYIKIERFGKKKKKMHKLCETSYDMYNLSVYPEKQRNQADTHVTAKHRIVLELALYKHG